MAEAEMARIADWIADVLAAPGDRKRIEAVRASVLELCEAFPLYAELASTG
jgi:glycine/serine hydroxymethyltransferase